MKIKIFFISFFILIAGMFFVSSDKTYAQKANTVQCPTCTGSFNKLPYVLDAKLEKCVSGSLNKSPTPTTCENLGSIELSCNGAGTSGGCKTDSTTLVCTQCPAGYDTFWNCPFRVGDIPENQVCCKNNKTGIPEYSPLVSCSDSCTIPGGCNPDGTYDVKCRTDSKNLDTSSCDTAIGPIGTTVGGFINSLFVKILGIVGGIAVILIIISGYKLMTSQGNPEKVQGAKEQLTAAIIGLLFVIFSLVILQVIGYDILKLPGFKP